MPTNSPWQKSGPVRRWTVRQGVPRTERLPQQSLNTFQHYLDLPLRIELGIIGGETAGGFGVMP